MAAQLTSVSISYKNQNSKQEDALTEAPQTAAKEPVTPRTLTSFTRASTPAEALEILRNEPDYETLISTLRFLKEDAAGFKITTPGPLAAQLINVLVSDIVPNYWSTLLHEDNERKSKGAIRKRESELSLLFSFLQSVTGLNAILLRLKHLIQQSKETKKTTGGSSILENLKLTLNVLSESLRGNETVFHIWTDISAVSDTSVKQKALWQELLGLVGSGKIIGLSAEAEDIVNNSEKRIRKKCWIGESSSYNAWLGRNITWWARQLSGDTDRGWKPCSELLGKALRLGHTETIFKECLESLIVQQGENMTQFLKLLGFLTASEQRNLLHTALKLISRDYLSAVVTSEDDSQWWTKDGELVSAAARLIHVLTSGDETRKSQLISWLTTSSGAGLGDGIAIRRAAVTALSGSADDLESVLDRSLKQFGDQLYIRHTPTLQQEVHAQVVLLAAGQVHRRAPLRLSRLMRKGSHMSVVSNRLASSSPRCRFLGMVIGEALSGLVDNKDAVLDFKVDEMGTPEAKWFKNLVQVSDTIGSLDALRGGANTRMASKTKVASKKPMEKPKVPVTGSKIISIEEVDDDDLEEESDDDGLIPYAKPDSDAEDSDEDPTLITRNKPKAPVYIRDLISFFRATDDYDRQKLALTTAAPLIRRKANFGTEVTSHAEELATLLVGLQDKYELENFQDMRLQGMIAVLVASPANMGPWFSKTFFDGDYSISQRAAILTTIGFGARELGGFGAEDKPLTTMNPLPTAVFPSKTLPPAMHKLYALGQPPPTPPQPTHTSPLSTLTTHLTKTMLTPLATSLASSANGPSILQVRTFSTRLAVEAARSKPTSNPLQPLVGPSFFYPLTGRFFIHLRTLGASSRSNIAFQPFLLALFLQTLSLTLHAAGPATPALPSLIAEFFELLLGLRTQALGDTAVTEALLFAFLTILELSEDKRALVERHGRQLLETQEWVEAVFARVGGTGSAEDEKMGILAAGCLVRIRECVEKYQALLMGEMSGF